ncbi:MAG TPA: class I SAM-dependent methyltransferase [Gaiellaceae bacterium]|nr:class I SAM-dependent methyltransferase [Gaiellaceae bacterium]
MHEELELQYTTEHRLVARASVWENDPHGPVAFLLEAIARERPARVLDAGCGPGWHGARIAERTGAHVVAADQSPRMVELAAERGLEAVVADVQTLPFDDAAFDCVLAAWMLYHVRDLDRGVAELRRVLRPGGLLVAATNGEGHLAELLERVGLPRFALPFSRENGAGILRRSFASVERRDFTTRARFPDRDAVVRYVSSMSRAAEVPEDVEPFEAHGEPTVFLAR